MKKIHYFLFFIYIFSAQYLFSQDYFFKTVGNDSINTFLRAGLVVEDDFLVVGDFVGRLTGYKGIYLSKLNSKGDILESIILDKNGISGNIRGIESGKTFISIKNSNAFALAYSKYKTGDEVDYDIVLLKFTKEGEILWSQKYGDSRRQGASTVIETSDNGFIVGGWENDNLNTPKQYNTFYIIKTDSLGNQEWTQTYTLNERQGSVAHNIIETLDGGYLIGGYGHNITLLPLGNYGADKQSYLVKIDSLGNVEWEKSYGVAEYRWDDGELDVLQYPDSTYLVFGGRAASKNGALHQFFKHLDSQGETLSESIYEEGRISSIYTGLHSLADGGFIGIPYERMSLNDEGYVIVRPRMIRYTPFGADTLWSKLLDIAPNMAGIGFRDVEPTPDGGFFIVGFSEHTSPQFGWVLKVDSLGNGCFEFGCDSSTITHIEELPKSEQKLFTLFPNPTQGEVTVSFYSPFEGGVFGHNDGAL